MKMPTIMIDCTEDKISMLGESNHDSNDLLNNLTSISVYYQKKKRFLIRQIF